MNVPISALEIADIVYEPKPGGYTIGEIERAMTVVKLIAAAKSIAIDQLEVTIREVRDQNTELQAHNTQLLLRARKAEDALKAYNIGLEPSGPPSFCGRQGGSCQCTSIDECIAK